MHALVALPLPGCEVVVRNRLRAFEQLLDEMYDEGRVEGLRGRPKSLGAFNRHANRAYEAGWHHGRMIRNGIIGRLRRDATDADLVAAADAVIEAVEP